MERQTFHVLMTSISKKVPMIKAIAAACKKIGTDVQLFGADRNPDCIGKYFVDSFWPMPATSDVLVKDVLHFCTIHGIRAIIPSRDGELLFFARHKLEFEQNGIGVMVGDVQTVELCLDKLLFCEKLRSLGLPAISTALSIEEIQSSKFVVKERFGAGSRGIAIGVSKEAAIAHATTLEHPVFQPFVAGQEYSVDLFCDKVGAVKGVVTRTRDVVEHGESQVTTTVSHPRLEALVREIALGIGLREHAVVQGIEDQEGAFHILEANSRFGGASTLSIATGLDSFYWFLLEAAGENLKHYPCIRAQGERRQIRFLTDMIQTIP